jgi:hypothetical protein
MKAALACIFAAALCLGASSAFAANTARYFCKRQSGGPESDFAMTIDFDSKDVDVPQPSGFQPYEPGQVTVTDKSVEWSFMRGFVEFDRKTGVLDWDTTAERDYLEQIGQLEDDQPVTLFRGRMQCEKLAP